MPGDFVFNETGGVAASTDGKKLAFAALGGLYLYDLESGNLTTLLDLSQNAGTASIGISMLNGAAFAQGSYVATAVLDGKLTVRVYDVASGELVATEVIENSDPTYFNHIPKIYLLDGTKTAVVVLGGSISEVDTLVSTFTFGE